MSKKKAQAFIRQKKNRLEKIHHESMRLHIIPLLCALIFTGFVLYLTFGEIQRFSRGTVITDETVSEYEDKLNSANTQDVSYEIIMNTKWEFPDSKSPSDNAYVKNSENNTNNVYFTVTLTDQPDTILYSSRQLAIGDSLKNITLARALPKGEYNALLTYYLLDSSGNCVSTVPMKIQIVIAK